MRLCDGAIVVVDVVEGVCPQVSRCNLALKLRWGKGGQGGGVSGNRLLRKGSGDSSCPMLVEVRDCLTFELDVYSVIPKLLCIILHHVPQI